MTKRMSIAILAALAILPPLPLSARPFLGFSVDAEAGLAPLIFNNHDGAGFRIAFPIDGGVTIESNSALGFSLMVYPVFSSPTYPPDPYFASIPWFYGAEEIWLGLPLGGYDPADGGIGIRLGPSVYAAWAPFYYWFLGGGLALDLEIADAATGSLLRPIGLYGRLCYRPSVLGYNLFLQAGLRFTALW